MQFRETNFFHHFSEDMNNPDNGGQGAPGGQNDGDEERYWFHEIFSVIHILREILVGESRVSGTAILTYLRGFEL